MSYRNLCAALVCLCFAASASAETYKYDALGRLITVERPGQAAQSFTYDKVGNRTQVGAPSSTNRAPIAVDDQAWHMVGDGGAWVQPLANDSDPDNNPLSITGWSAPSTVSVQWDSASKWMTLSASNAGSYTITYTLSDGAGGTAQGRIFLTVDPNDQQCQNPYYLSVDFYICW